MSSDSYADPHCDPSRITLSPEARELWPQIRDECRTFDRAAAFSPGADNLVAWGLVTRFDLGPAWKLMRSLRGMKWAMGEGR